MKEIYFNRDTRMEDKQTYEDAVIVCESVAEYNKVLRKFRKEFKDYGDFSIERQQAFETLFGIEINAKGFKLTAEDHGGVYLRFVTKYFIQPKA